MLNKIKVTPLAAESLGVRSMCTLVETPDVTVLLDAGVSLAPYRFSLLPHPIEFQTIARLRKRIAEAAEKAQVVTISHYHFDHHTPSYEDAGKLDPSHGNSTPNLPRQNDSYEKP